MSGRRAVPNSMLLQLVYASISSIIRVSSGKLRFPESSTTRQTGRQAGRQAGWLADREVGRQRGMLSLLMHSQSIITLFKHGEFILVWILEVCVILCVTFYMVGWLALSPISTWRNWGCLWSSPSALTNSAWLNPQRAKVPVSLTCGIT